MGLYYVFVESLVCHQNAKKTVKQVLEYGKAIKNAGNITVNIGICETRTRGNEDE